VRRQRGPSEQRRPVQGSAADILVLAVLGLLHSGAAVAGASDRDHRRVHARPTPRGYDSGRWCAGARGAQSARAPAPRQRHAPHPGLINLPTNRPILPARILPLRRSPRSAQSRESTGSAGSSAASSAGSGRKPPWRCTPRSTRLRPEGTHQSRPEAGLGCPPGVEQAGASGLHQRRLPGGGATTSPLTSASHQRRAMDDAVGDLGLTTARACGR